MFASVKVNVGYSPLRRTIFVKYQHIIYVLTLMDAFPYVVWKRDDGQALCYAARCHNSSVRASSPESRRKDSLTNKSFWNVAKLNIWERQQQIIRH